MTGNLVCRFCASNDTFIINTYKHYWVLCNRCGCAYRKRKEKYFFSSFAYGPGRRLGANPAVIADASKIYDYFTSESDVKKSLSIVGRFLENQIRRWNIKVEGKRILDISGGGGHFIKQFEKLGAQVALTEFNKKAVDYARETYVIEAQEFDFNVHSLSDLFDGKFDLIFLRAAIMFCLDITKFLSDLRKIIHPETMMIYTDCVLPSIGVFLRWQLDDYTYNVLYQPEEIITIHNDQGFELFARDEQPPYVYTLNQSSKFKAFSLMYEIPAALKIPFYSKFTFRDRHQRASNLIFKAPAQQDGRPNLQ